MIVTAPHRGQDSEIGIATRYRLEGPGIESRWGQDFSTPIQTGPAVHPAFCTMGTRSFPEVKADEVRRLPPTPI